MRKVKIITDSCADLNQELLERYDIDYVKMSTVCDGVETPASLTWTPDEVKAFYNKMREGKRITTAQVSVEEFNRVFKKYLDEGFDIVYIACSLRLSGSVNTGSVVAAKLGETYPDAKIICIDSLNSSVSEGMVAMEAAKLAAEGKCAEEIAVFVKEMRNTALQYATVHTLNYLKQAGRVSASKAFFGNLMGVKPILVSDVNGAQAAYKKAKGRSNSLREIVSLLKNTVLDSENQTIYIAHSDCNEEDLNALVEAVKAEIPCKDIYICYIGPIVGASVGPDCIGVWGFGNAITFSGDEA